ncbi:hypothetical protein [Brevibacillus centrosporus]|uniref:Major facilitator superfamily (MFS) profile domain-containing protein n=1 Tax=Brevibacillus centrosporus TaxID=54910 RepID=A0A1I4AY72_9BACL|nr:hypothetical protein [Brevibacillus centrosporus]SFK61562.1 hypothetical protein SAMN05518846_11674 [Brevibacillus centrosporus]
MTVRSFQQYGFTITLLFLGWFVSSMDRMFINIAIVPIGEELHMDAASLGIVLSIAFAYLIVGNLVSLVMGLFLGKTKKLFAATPYS